MELVDFIIKVHISGYALSGEDNEFKLDDGGLCFTSKEDDLEYTDIYYGFNPFIGQEIIRQKSKAIWVMNYSGETVLQGKEALEIYSFLKLALLNPDPEIPLRGPSVFRKDNFVYNNSVSGNIDRFSGEEVIQVGGVSVYKCHYHGGEIKRD